VTIWDHGTYDNLLAEKATPQSVAEGIAAGRLEFALHGRKLRGRFALIRMHGKGKENWLLIKLKDEFAASAGPHKLAPPRKAWTSSRVKSTVAPPSNSRRHKPPRELPTPTHPDKVMYPDLEITKGDVFAFYQRVAPYLLPYLRNRPATLERLPEGLGESQAPHFWQKNTPAYYPDWIPRIELSAESGKHVHYVLVNDLATLLYLVNQGTLTFHVWLSQIAHLDRPDFVLFDLDPGQARFADAVAVAQELHRILTAERRRCFVKTSGKSGLHVFTPWKQAGDHDAARAWALGIAERVAEAMSNQATVERSKSKRGRRVYVDVMQNAKGHHVVPPYVLRPVPGAPVSTPLAWRELTPDLDPAAFNLKTLFRRLAKQKSDPMAGLVSTVAGRRTAAPRR
jgi:bifunctional non-homologous end joining protein LigD